MKKIEKLQELLLDYLQEEYRNLYGRVIHEGVSVPAIAFEINLKEEQSIYEFVKIFSKMYKNSLQKLENLEKYLDESKKKSYFTEREEKEILGKIIEQKNTISFCETFLNSI